MRADSKDGDDGVVITDSKRIRQVTTRVKSVGLKLMFLF